MRQRSRAVDIRTVVHNPGFPTGYAGAVYGIECRGGGSCRVVETIFENRFMHVPELEPDGGEHYNRGQYGICAGCGTLFRRSRQGR